MIRPELRWKDRPLPELIRLSWPITVSTLSYSAMTLVDTLLIGHVGRAELAGVGLAGIAAFVFLCFSIGLLRGANTLVSQADGAGRAEEIRPYQGAALVVAVALGLGTILLGQVAAQLMPHLTASAGAGEAARTYLGIRILGAPLVLIFVALREVRYGQGESRSPMRASLVANLVNIGLAYLFIFILHRGVAGAALATVIAHGLEAALLAVPMARRDWGLGDWTARHLRALWRLGSPLGLQMMLEVGAFALLSLFIALYSDVDMAAHQIAIQVIHLSFLPAFAVAEATAVLAGQAVGANRDDLVKRIARLAMAVTGAYALVWTLILAFGAAWIVAAFTPDREVITTAVMLLHIAAIFQMADAANVVARGTLRGTGDVRYSAVVGVLTSWVCTPPLAWLLGYRLQLGARGGWLGLTLEIIVAGALLWWRLERNGWARAAAAARGRLEDAAPGPGAPEAPPAPAAAPLNKAVA